MSEAEKEQVHSVIRISTIATALAVAALTAYFAWSTEQNMQVPLMAQQNEAILTTQEKMNKKLDGIHTQIEKSNVRYSELQIWKTKVDIQISLQEKHHERCKLDLETLDMKLDGNEHGIEKCMDITEGLVQNKKDYK